MKKYIICLFCITALIWGACSEYVEDVDPIVTSVQDDLLTAENQMDFIMIGVKVKFAQMTDNLMVLAEAVSDAMIFDDNVPNATYPSFREADERDIDNDNNSVDGVFNGLGELRFYADDLLRRVAEIDFEDADLKRQAQYVGNLYGGIARYHYATYFGLDETTGGGVISEGDEFGPFTPSADMYNLALTKWQAALTFTGSAEETRIVNSLIARLHLYAGNAAAALASAQSGMIEGDDQFESKYSTQSTNQFWQHAGRGRSQLVADWRFYDYVQADPAEANRILFEPIDGSSPTPFPVYYLQIKYGAEGTPLAFMTWQENELMLAELELGTDNASALARLTAVRASHDISAYVPLDPGGVLTIDDILLERDKELWLTGARMVDQRRFSLWHTTPGSWEYLPITRQERELNPNFN